MTRVTAGGTVSVPSGHDRHTLVVWARGAEGAERAYAFRFSVSTDQATTPFLDIENIDPLYQSVTALAEAGIVSGREQPPGSELFHFGPNESLWRAQFAKMIDLDLALQVNEGRAPLPFRDVERPLDNVYPDDFVADLPAPLFHPSP